jgi:hypothetical protein
MTAIALWGQVECHQKRGQGVQKLLGAERPLHGDALHKLPKVGPLSRLLQIGVRPNADRRANPLTR